MFQMPAWATQATVDEMRTIASDPHTKALFAASGMSSVEDIVQKAIMLQECALRGDAKRPYVCVMRGAFLRPRVVDHPSYPLIMSQQAGERCRFLDLGCCMGTDLRQMLLDGAQKELVHGVDFSPDFIRLGFELFGDEATMDGVFQRVDILDGWDSGSELGASSATGWMSEHVSSFDVVHCGAVLHTLESKEEVQEVLKRVFCLLAPGGVYFGGNRPTWVHDAKSFHEELESVGFEGVEVTVRSGQNEADAENVLFKNASAEESGRGTYFVAFKPH
ncbi:unnamed protein product [Polarella glacialis]|uniref:Methyltransferase type 12 domain-containing protein n=1 Tax=Polarella glacialis TaxID=89957 RepID=A0A813GQV3_POLGL|nr:unnamed protein product [Polarella glacialis]